jgi:outer membrane protein assembly factor BamE (lipoprotein component of BamABCDE complex)
MIDFSKTRIQARNILTAALLTLAFATTGCVVSSSSTETHTGTQVSDATFSQIKSGVTTNAWVQATLGAPTSKTNLDNGHELWRYDYTSRTVKRGAVIVLLASDHTTETTQTAFVEFKDGVVVNAWRS